MKHLNKHGLFNTMESVESAMQYADQIINAIPKEDRMPAYTALYVMYNTIIKYYQEQDK